MTNGPVLSAKLFLSPVYVCKIDTHFRHRTQSKLVGGAVSLHCALSCGAVYCNRSCLFVCVFADVSVCVWVC